MDRKQYRYEKRSFRSWKADKSHDRRLQPHGSCKVPKQQSHNKGHQWQGPVNYGGSANQSLPWWHNEVINNTPFFFDFAGSSSQFSPTGVGSWGAVQYVPGTVASSHSYGPVDQGTVDIDKAQKYGSDWKRDRSFRSGDRDRNGRERSERSSGGKSPAAKRRAVEEGPTDDTVCVKLSEQTTSVINDILNGGAAMVTCMVSENEAASTNQKTSSIHVPGNKKTKTKELPKKTQQTIVTTTKETSAGYTKAISALAGNSTSMKQALAASAARGQTNKQLLSKSSSNRGIVNGNVSGRNNDVGTTCKTVRLNELMVRPVQHERTKLQLRTSGNSSTSFPKNPVPTSQEQLKSPRQFNPVYRSSDCSERTKEVVSRASSLTCGEKVIAQNSASSSAASVAKTNLIKLSSAPRSRREQIELEQMLHEHASRKTSRKLLPAATQETRTAGCDNLNILNADVIITPVSQTEVAREIGLDLSELDSTSDSALSDLNSCVLVDDDSEQDSSIGKAVQQNAEPVSPSKTSSAVTFGAASVSNLSDTSQVSQTATHLVQDSCSNVVQQEALANANCSPVLTRTGLTENNMVNGTVAVTNHGQAAMDTAADPGNPQEPLSTVLQISLQEETVRKQLEDVRLEINRLRMQMMMLKNQLDSRMHVRAMLLLEENRLRQARLRILQDSVVSSSQPADQGVASPIDTEVNCDVGYENNEDGNESDFCSDVQPIMIAPDANVQPVVIEPDEGIQPITIEPDASGEHSDDSCTQGTLVQVSTNNSVQPEATSNNSEANVQAPNVRVLYCGTLTGDQLLAPGMLTELAQNLVAGFRSPPCVEYLTNLATSRPPNVSESSTDGINGCSPLIIKPVKDDCADRTLSDVEPDDDNSSVPAPVVGVRPTDPKNFSVQNTAGSVCCVSVQNDAVVYACTGGSVFRQPFLSNGCEHSSVDRQVYRRHEGRVLCMLMTRVGVERDAALFTVGEDRRLVVVGYPIQATKQIFTGIECYQPNCMIQIGGCVYVGLRSGRVAVFHTQKVIKRRKTDILCGYGNLSHVCALAMAQKGNQKLLCIAVSNCSDIQVRDASNAKPFGKNLIGLPRSAVIMHGLSQWVISSSGNNEVYIHSLQSCTMEKTLSFAAPIVSIVCKPKDRQVVVADGSGTISWIGVKDGVRYTMYTQYSITALGCCGDLMYVGCSDGEVYRVQYDLSMRLKCRYLHCKFMCWRSRDLKRHLIDDHIGQIRSMSNDSNVVVCKWDKCMEVISTDAKMMRRHFYQHVTAEFQLTERS